MTKAEFYSLISKHPDFTNAGFNMITHKMRGAAATKANIGFNAKYLANAVHFLIGQTLWNLGYLKDWNELVTEMGFPHSWDDEQKSLEILSSGSINITS